ncbi:MAG: D-alanyl-D-alanine carboxypeptidase [Firmicutes bacterium]|nr:D-alanyl-D-alanine carboxypeptidase [Bacillota bacterium]MDY6161004.1 D-alanyl-D-alanine carboxypeptidase family protein [Candidatus Faecousia sp.]
MGHCKARLIGGVLCVLLVLTSVPAKAEETLQLASQAAVLMDADTGVVLYEKNMNEQLYPASITKLMTALLAMEALEPEQVLTVSQTAVNAVPRTSSHIGLLAGERLTVDQALYAIGMESANDAANVLAEAVSGSLEAFAEKMNEKARELGALNTHFTNANGLPDSGHVTTAYDMALITAAALKQEGLATYFSTVNYTLSATNLSSARSFANKDRLLPGGQYYYDGVLLAKTGWTSSAQGTFAAAVRKGQTTLVAITLKSPLLEDKYKDTHKLLDYGFSHYSSVNVSGEQITAQLSLGEYTPVKGQKFSYLIPAGALFTDIRYSLSEDAVLSENGPLQTTVGIDASLEGAVLPQVQVKLERPAPQREAFILAELLSAGGTSPEQVQAILNALRIPAAVVGVLLLIFMVLLFRRQLQRHRRRRHLKARIRRMKKRME